MSMSCSSRLYPGSARLDWISAFRTPSTALNHSLCHCDLLPWQIHISDRQTVTHVPGRSINTQIPRTCYCLVVCHRRLNSALIIQTATGTSFFLGNPLRSIYNACTHSDTVAGITCETGCSTLVQYIVCLPSKKVSTASRHLWVRGQNYIGDVTRFNS